MTIVIAIIGVLAWLWIHSIATEIRREARKRYLNDAKHRDDQDPV